MVAANTGVSLINLTARVRRFFISIWTIPIAVLLIVGAALTRFAIDEYNQTLEQEYRFLEVHARIAEARIEDALHLVDQLLARAADDQQTATPLTHRQLQERNRERLQPLPEVSFLLVTDRSGRIITSVSSEGEAAERAAQNFDASGRDYFTVHRDRRKRQANWDAPFITRPFVNAVGNMVFVVSRAIRGADGRFEGVAAASLSDRYFDSVLSEIRPVGEGSAASLVNRQGDMLYHLPDPQKYVGSNVAKGLSFQEFVQSGKPLLRTHGVATLSGMSRVFLFKSVGNTDFSIALSRLSDDVFASWRGNLLIRWLIFMLAAAVTLSLTWIAHRRSMALVEANRLLNQDIEARQRTEDALRLYASVFQQSGSAILISDDKNRILAVNDAFTRMSGYVGNELKGRNPRVLASGQTPLATYSSMWTALKERGFWEGEIWDRRKDGTVYPKLMSVTAMQGLSGGITHYVASFIDISERKAAEERIKRLAHHDALTGLLNRISLREGLEEVLAAAQRDQQSVAVMFIDMDHFKEVNDSLGHAAGDELLVGVARRLRECVRESDLVARLGGDEFVIVLTGVLESGVTSRVANKILTSLGQPYFIGGQKRESTPSIGIAYYPVDGGDVETLLKHADAAMYVAKERGRNNAQFYSQHQ